MTRQEATERKHELEKRRQTLVDQLTSIDVSSATLSAAGGSKSYTNRSVADIRAKIAFLDQEIAGLEAALGTGIQPGQPTTHYVEFNA